MPKKINKARVRDARRHAIRRAKERYGLELGLHDLERISALIRDGCAMLVDSQSHTRKFYVVRHQGEYLPVVYGAKIRTLHTFLPQEVLTDKVLEGIDKFKHW